MAGEQLWGDLVSLETTTVDSTQTYANTTKDAVAHLQPHCQAEMVVRIWIDMSTKFLIFILQLGR